MTHDLLNLTDIRAKIIEVRTSPTRLLLLIGPEGSGKTRHLLALEAKYGYQRIAIGAILAQQLRSIAKRRRPNQVQPLLSDMFREVREDVILLDTIELLFLPELEQSPLDLLKGLARNHTVCAAWPGQVQEDGSLIYARVGHPEYRRYADPRTQFVKMPGTL